MGFVSLFFLIVFTLHYVGNSLENKPDFIVSAIDKIEANIDNLAFWGLFFGLLATILTPMAHVNNSFELLVRFVANIWIVVLALPLSLDHLLEKYKEKLSEPLAEELRNIGSAVTRRGKVFGYTGAVLCVMLFAMMFR